MPASQSRASYEDCFAYLDQALEQPDGIRISVGQIDDDDSQGKARQLQVRLHYARTLDRRDNEKIYAKDHPSHGTSVYDPLIVKIRIADEEVWVYIEPCKANGKVEPIKPGGTVTKLPRVQAPALSIAAPDGIKRRKL